MPLEWRYTYNGTDNGLPDESLGGDMSATQLSLSPKNNLFDDVSPLEARDGDTEYRCLVLYANGSNYSNVFIYIDPETTSGNTQIDLAWEGKNPASPTTIPDEDTAPDQSNWEETDFTHRSKNNKLHVSDMVAGDKHYIWFRRTVSPGASPLSDSAGIIVEYE